MHIHKIHCSNCSLVLVRCLFISSAHAGWINHRNNCLANGQQYRFSSPTRISPASSWQPCSARQNWWPPACRLTTRYQQTCFRLLFSTGDYIAIKISTWCQYNAKFIHNLHVLSSATRSILWRGTQSSCHCFWTFCLLLKETLQGSTALQHRL